MEEIVLIKSFIFRVGFIVFLSDTNYFFVFVQTDNDFAKKKLIISCQRDAQCSFFTDSTGEGVRFGGILLGRRQCRSGDH